MFYEIKIESTISASIVSIPLIGLYTLTIRFLLHIRLKNDKIGHSPSHSSDRISDYVRELFYGYLPIPRSGSGFNLSSKIKLCSAYLRQHASSKSKFYSSQSEKLTLTTEANGIRNIILNNPKTRNALSLDMMSQLLRDIKRNENDENLRCIVLSASSGNIFSAGHNLKELTAETGIDFHRSVFAKASELMVEIMKSPVPVIARVDGLAAAAGCQLVAACDLVVCSDRSSFSTPGANFGIFCSTPGIQVVRNIPKKKAAYMLFTGLPLSAQEALTAGLVSSCVPVTHLDEEIEKICDSIKAKSRVVVELGKKFYYEQMNMDINVAYKYGEQVMVDNLALSDGQEAIRSFIEKRKPNWTNNKTD